MHPSFGKTVGASGHHGVWLIDGVCVADTKRCCHCGCHFTMVKGSGKTRGYCMECGDVTCGRSRCDSCLPFQKRLDLYEKGQIESM